MGGAKIPWSRYFDHIYCMHFVGNTERMAGVTAELERVGILGSGIFSFVHTSPDPWEAKLMELYPKCAGRHASARGFLNLGLASARAMREALALGYRRVLFLEDDVRFLKSPEELDRALAATPPGFNIVQYDKFIDWEWDNTAYRVVCEANPLNDYYFEAFDRPMYSSACFMADTWGMKKMLAYMENVRPVPFDTIMHCVGATHAVAKKNLAIQIVYGDAMIWSYFAKQKANTHHRAYAPMNLKYEDYAVPEGYGYAVEKAAG